MSVKVVNSGTGEKCTIDGKPIDGELNLNKVTNLFSIDENLSDVSPYNSQCKNEVYMSKLKESNRYIRLNIDDSAWGNFQIIDSNTRKAVLNQTQRDKYDSSKFMLTKTYIVDFYEDYDKSKIQQLIRLSDLKIIELNNSNLVKFQNSCVDYDNDIVYTINEGPSGSNYTSDFYKYILNSNQFTKILNFTSYSVPVSMCVVNNEIYILKRGNANDSSPTYDHHFNNTIYKISNNRITQIGTSPKSNVYGTVSVYHNGNIYNFDARIYKYSLSGQCTDIGINKLGFGLYPYPSIIDYNGSIYIAKSEYNSCSSYIYNESSYKEV